MVNVYESILQELERRKYIGARIFAPFYITSIGTHIFNIENKQKYITNNGVLEDDTRVHMFFVAPPGFSKSITLRQFSSGRNAILFNTSIPSVFMQGMSTPGFVGKIDKDEEGKTVIKDGIAKAHSTSIVCIEEFQALVAVMQQKWGNELEPQLLTALDTGEVIRTLANGEIRYNTYLTLWAGTQPARFDLGGGMGRRLVFVLNFPTYKDLNDLKLGRRAAKNIPIELPKIEAVRLAIDNRAMAIRQDLKSVVFSHKFYETLDKYHLLHTEETLFERIALGYTLMSSETIKSEMVVDTTPELERILKLQDIFRTVITKDPQLAMVWRLIKDETKVPITRTLNILRKMQMDMAVAKTKLATLEHVYKWIKNDGAGYYDINRPDGKSWIDFD